MTTKQKVHEFISKYMLSINLVVLIICISFANRSFK